MFQKAKQFLSGVSAGEEPLDVPEQPPPPAATNPPHPKDSMNDEIECEDAFIPNVIIDQPQLSYRASVPENANLGLDRDPFTQQAPRVPTPDPSSFFQPTDYKSITSPVYPLTSKVSDPTRDQTITGYYDNNPHNSRLFSHHLKDGKLLSTKVFHPNGSILHELTLQDGQIKSSKNFNPLGKINLSLEPLPKSNIFSGTEYNNDFNITFKGEFLNGRRNGPGKEYNDLKVNITDGLYKDGRLGSKGVKYYDNGNRMYEGEFVGGLKGGYGVSYYKNGKKKFDGWWLRDMYHGKGRGYYVNGVISLEGRFIKGQKVWVFFFKGIEVQGGEV